MLPAALPSRPRATLASPEPGGWPKKTWSARAPPLGPALSGGLSLSASFAWLIFLPRLFVSVCPLFAIPGPHSRLEATRSWPVSENGRWEGRVCSLYFFSVGNSRSLFRQWAPLECTEAALMRWPVVHPRVASQSAGLVPGGTGGGPGPSSPCLVPGPHLAPRLSRA